MPSYNISVCMVTLVALLLEHVCPQRSLNLESCWFLAHLIANLVGV
jgi:hypothetical protein